MSLKDVKTLPYAKAHPVRMAGWVAVCVCLFAALFMALIIYLNSLVATGETERADVANSAQSDPFYVLLIGSDSRKGTALYTGKANEHAQLDQHSDVLTLVRVDPSTYTITLVTIPRDTVLNNESCRINDHLARNNPEEVVGAVRELTGIYADYYMMTTFPEFIDFINDIGGVVVNVPADIEVSDPETGGAIKVKAGDNRRLNGAQALALCRARKEYSSGDAMRQQNVRNVETALIMQVANLESVDAARQNLAALESHVDTNMDTAVMSRYALDFLANRSSIIIYSCAGPYDGGGERADGMWVIPEQAGTWRELMSVVDSGQDPSAYSSVAEL